MRDHYEIGTCPKCGAKKERLEEIAIMGYTEWMCEACYNDGLQTGAIVVQ